MTDKEDRKIAYEGARLEIKTDPPKISIGILMRPATARIGARN